MTRRSAILVVLCGLLPWSQLAAAHELNQPAVNGCRSDPSAYETWGPQPDGARFNDPLFKEQWGLRQINVPAAWQQGAFGKGTVIAVIDSGVDLHHPDLKRNLVSGVDLGPEGAPGDCPGPQDEDGHGTHVAGIIAAVGDNGIGTVGVAPQARVMPIQITDLEELQSPTSGYEKVADINQRLAAGIRYATDHEADVINVSMTSFPYVEAPGSGVSDAIRYAWDHGVLVVAAAGNDGDLGPFCQYPSSDPLVLCVGATDRKGDVTPYSNDPAKVSDDTAVLGPGGNETDFVDCESGDLVWSSVLPTDWDCGTRGYATYGGTSMASPAVAGVAALLFGSGLDNEEVVACLLRTSSNNGTYDRSTGYGIVNAGKAIRSCAG